MHNIEAHIMTCLVIELLYLVPIFGIEWWGVVSCVYMRYRVGEGK